MHYRRSGADGSVTLMLCLGAVLVLPLAALLVMALVSFDGATMMHLARTVLVESIVTSFLLVVLVSLSLLGIILLNYFRDYTMQQEKNALILNAQIIETSLEDSLYSKDVAGLHTTLQELHEKTDLRVTVIDADGAVLGDTAHHSHVPALRWQPGLSGGALHCRTYSDR